METDTSFIKNPLLSSTNTNKDKPTTSKNKNLNLMVGNSNAKDQNTSQNSNVLNTSITNDTIKILNLLKTNTNNHHPSTIQEYTYEDVKSICLRVFMSYAKPRNGQFYLSYQNLFKILKFSGIINETTFLTKDADILAQKINKGISQFTSENFLNFLTRICAVTDDNFYNDKKGCFIKMIKTHLEPLIPKIESAFEASPKASRNHKSVLKSSSSSMIFSNTSTLNQNGSMKLEKFMNNYQLDENSYLIITSIAPGLKVIYNNYFIYETSRHHDLKKIERGSFENFFQFVKDFQIMPYLISKNTLELYWSMVLSSSVEELINNADISHEKFNEKFYNLGTIYTFPKFMLFFPHVAGYYYDSVPDKSRGEKLLYLIEHIYSSKGYNNLNKKKNVPYQHKFTLIPPKEVIELINRKLLEDSEKEKVRKKRVYTNWHASIKEFLELNQENYDLLQPYIEKLRNIFGIYCKLGDKLQYGKMSFSNYQKMLTDGELLYFHHRQKRNNSQKKLNLTIYENNPNMGRYSNGTTFKFNMNNSSSNLNPILSKSMSQQLFQVNKSGLDTSTLNKSTTKKFSFEVRRRNKLTIADINLIFFKIAGFINFNDPDLHKDKITQTISLNTGRALNVSTTKKNGPLKLNFFLFMKTFPLIAFRFYPNEEKDLNEAMKQFLEEKMGDFVETLENKTEIYHDNQELTELIEHVCNNEALTELMKDIAPLMKQYFLEYAEKIGKTTKISFEGFIFFLKDYNIYPQWLSLVNLKEIFYSQIKRKNEKTNLDFNAFNECMVTIGICMNSGDDFDWSDKILFMLDKMFAEGAEQNFKKTGNTFNEKKDYTHYEKALMKKYPNYYNKKYDLDILRYENSFYFKDSSLAGDSKKNSMLNLTRKDINFEDIFASEKK